MGSIQSGIGLTTGFAIDDTVDQLMAINAVPRDRLVNRTAGLQQEQVALTELTTLVVAVQLTTDRFGQSSLFSSSSVTSSNEAITATNTGSPAQGTYSFVPARLAQSQQLTSSLFASSDQQVGSGEIVIHRGGFLDDSVALDELNGGSGVSRGYLKITDRGGNSATIDLRFAETITDVVDSINASGASVVATVNDNRLVLSDVSGSTTTNLTVEEVGGGTTARDLGVGNISVAASSATGAAVYGLSQNQAISVLLDGRGLDIPASGNALSFQLQDGSTVDVSLSLDANKASLGQLIDAINDAGAGSLAARIGADGVSLEVEDLTSGGTTFSVSSPTGNLAEQLGLDNASVGGVVTGDRILSGLNDVLLSSLNGGNGYSTLGQVTITDRSGTSDTIDLGAAETLQEVLDIINASSASVTAQLNRTNTGIEIVDNTGSTANDLIIANADATNSATALQIEGSFAADKVDSSSLNRQYVSRTTQLSELNQGAGVRLGSFTLTDSNGATSSLNLSSGTLPESVGDVIDKINALALGITASLNETGDGILLVDTAGGSGTLTVTDATGSNAALDLGIAGSASTLTVGGSSVEGIDGSQTIRVATSDSTTIAELVNDLNGISGSPLSASVLNLSASGGVRVLINSSTSGTGGRLAIDSNIGISFSETAAARDALLAFGADDSNGGVLVSSSSNTFTGLLPDVDITLNSTTTSPVTVTVESNDDAVTKQVETFVDQFNKLRDKLDELTAFDETTNTVGLLFGKASALRVELSYSSFLSGSVRGAGSIASLGQLGIRLNESGKLEFDRSKFESAYAADSAAIEEFFTKADTGFSARAKAVADSLASVESGSLLNRNNTLTSQIEQNNERIAAFNLRLDRQRTRLLTQFYNMETTIARLQQNLSALNQLQVIPPLSSSSSG